MPRKKATPVSDYLLEESVMTPEMESKLHIEEPEDNPRYPAKIRMTRPHGFIDDFGSSHYWPQGIVLDSPEEIRTILDRGCKDYVVL